MVGVVYEELPRLAQSQRRRWSGDATLDTTALVHEAYLKLVGQPDPAWNDRGHFLAVAARAMRHLLVNYAERRRAAKRGGGASHISLDAGDTNPESATDFTPVSEEVADELIALHKAPGSRGGSPVLCRTLHRRNGSIAGHLACHSQTGLADG